jgi:hypothetical protein
MGTLLLGSKFDSLTRGIDRMPGATPQERIQAYAGLIEARIKKADDTTEWNHLMKLHGYVSGLCRFERDFPIELLPEVE